MIFLQLRTTSAPYLAICTLLQLASDEECRFPLGALAVREYTYMNDVLTGGDNLEVALEVKAQMIAYDPANLLNWNS